GIVDVSGHQVGTAFAAIFLLGIALYRPLSLKASRWVPMFFRIVGLGLLTAGVFFIFSAPVVELPPPPLVFCLGEGLLPVASPEPALCDTKCGTTVPLA